MTGERYERVKGYKRTQRIVPILLSIALLLTLAVGGTLAYIVTKSAMVQNQFEPGAVTCQVNDNGTVTNKGNINAYIRTAVVVNWMDKDGNVYGIKPNYEVTTNSGWSKNDDFYYYTSAVAPDGKTTTAPVKVTVSDKAPSSEYSLSIEIIAEAIQAEGYTDVNNVPAYENAWNITNISGQ